MIENFFSLMRQELVLIAVLFVFIVLKVSNYKGNVFSIASVLFLLNVFSSFSMDVDGGLFNGMFYTNSSIAIEKSILALATLIVTLSSYYWISKHQHALEFYMLLAASLLGMYYMLSAENFLMLYLGLELSAIPLAALANFDLDKAKSSEAGVKMILSSAFSSGILLFGVSLLYGCTGTLHFSEMIHLLNGSMLEVAAFIMVISGFAFKLSLVPFHLWTADVYEGAPTAVTAFLSVASKGSIMFLLIALLNKWFAPYEIIWVNVLLVLSAITITVGNLFALRQNNIKRLLAFSSVAQAGYILFGIASPNDLGQTSVIYFVFIYLFSNLGAFAVVNVLSAQTGKENISQLKGLYKNNPFLAITLMIFLFSLAGIPPTAGFFGKYFLLAAATKNQYYIYVIIGALNMIVSLYYYLKVVRAMYFDKAEVETNTVSINLITKLTILVCMLLVLALGFYGELWNIIAKLSLNL